MVNSEIVSFIQTKINTILADLKNSESENYDARFLGFTCVIHNEINYKFKKAEKKKIEANCLFGSATKTNDLENKYNMSFVVNIQSEVNGGELAKKLFDIFFKTWTRTTQTLGSYNAKIFFTSPVLTQPYYEIEDSFCCLYTLNGSVEFSENVVLGCQYQLSLDGTNYIDIKPRQPYIIKEAVGNTDTEVLASGSPTLFTKKSEAITINLVLLYEAKAGTTTAIANFNALFSALYNECYGASSQKYYFKTTANGITKTITNLICVRGQHIYDEATGENVLSLQFKVGA